MSSAPTSVRFLWEIGGALRAIRPPMRGKFTLMVTFFAHFPGTSSVTRVPAPYSLSMVSPYCLP